VQQRKNMFSQAAKTFLKVFTYPDDVIASIMETMHGLSLSHNINDAAGGSESAISAMIQKSQSFKVPFNIVAGTHTDAGVHKFWFVRKYRCVPSTTGGSRPMDDMYRPLLACHPLMTCTPTRR
jgi:hypothetical protein